MIDVLLKGSKCYYGDHVTVDLPKLCRILKDTGLDDDSLNCYRDGKLALIVNSFYKLAERQVEESTYTHYAKFNPFTYKGE